MWKKRVCLSLKATFYISFPVSYYEICRKSLTEDFRLGLLRSKIIMILDIFRILGFRGIGNIFFRFLFLSESWADERLGQIFIQVVLQFVLGRRLKKKFYREIHRPMESLKACGGQYFQIGVPSRWNEGKKGVACSNILWMKSESFSQDDVLDSCVI